MSVLFEKQGQIAVVTINRPEKRNALNSEVKQGLREAWRRFRSEEELRVAVLTAAGEKAFSAGKDLREPTNLEDTSWLEITGIDELEVDENLRKPVIAAIEGYCIGAGLTLAMSCDMRVAGHSATFSFTEVKWGLPVIIGSIRLPRIVGTGVALEILLTGEPIDATEAHRVGLVNRVVPDGNSFAVAMELARKVAANAPMAVQATREMVYRSASMSFRDAWRLGEGLRAAVRTSKDVREGLGAFADNRRAAEFKGK